MILEDLKTAVNAVLAIHLYFIQHLPIAIIIDKCRVDLVTSENYAHEVLFSYINLYGRNHYR